MICVYKASGFAPRLLRVWRVGPLSLAGLLWFATLLHSSDQENQNKRITASANLVVLPVNVTDSRGTFIHGLKKDDFRVFEDGRLQNIDVFDDQDAPVTVGLVVDHSRSMQSKLRDVAAAVNSFAHSSNSRDEMFVVDFNGHVTVEIMKGKAFSSDPKELSEAVGAVSARGRTALYDAVSEGLLHLQYGHLGKKALIIISDGGDNASHLKYSQVLAQARQSQTSIYSIALVGYEQDEENPGLLRKLCKDTGGIAYFPGPSQSVTDVATDIARDLREQYTLGYVPQAGKRTNAFRKIQVKVKATGHGSIKIRTRRGYSPAAGLRTTSPAAQALQ